MRTHRLLTVLALGLLTFAVTQCGGGSSTPTTPSPTPTPSPSPAPAPSGSGGSVSISPQTIQGQGQPQGTVTLANTAPSGGAVVQLASSNNRKNVLDLKTQFELLHTDVKAYFIYQQPYFQLRVGDFQTRMEANQFLQIVLKEFDSAFIVPDEISVVEE